MNNHSDFNWSVNCHRLFLFVLCWSITIHPGASTSMTLRGTASAVTKDATYDFDRMSNLIRRLDVLRLEAPSLLMGFYDPNLKSFSVKPQESETNRVCITSTCYALVQLSLSSVYDSTISYDEEGDEEGDVSRIPIRQVLKVLSESQWRESDMFQVPLLAYTILLWDTDRSLLRLLAETDQTVASKITRVLQAIMEAAPDKRNPNNVQDHSDYIVYQITKVAALLQDYHQTSSTGEDDEVSSSLGFGGLPPSIMPENLASDVFWVLLSCAEDSCNEICRQLAYRVAGDSNSFDVVRLAYSLLTYIKSTTSLSGIAGKETVPGEGPSTETKIPPLNSKLVTAALAAFFEEQNSDGMWDKGQPIYKSFNRQRGRTITNAFIFPVNIVGSLLCILPAEAFRPHLAGLERTLGWIESHQRLETIPDYCDADTGNWYGKSLRGWSSPHSLNPDAGPEAWPTAQVLKCVFTMRRCISDLMHNDVLEEFKGISLEGKQCRGWNRLLDTDLGNPCDEKGCRTIKDILEHRVIEPFATSIDNPSYGAAYSAILFGPPGGAKTTIIEALAERMGYDFVCIDTSTLMEDGLANVAARIRYVFTRLMALKNCVILFDEIEEFVLDRATPGISMESRMLTTAMLTAINDLRRHKQSIFFIATNRLKAFDSAITRPGRFDMTLFVGTPNLESRIIQLKEQLARVRVVKESIVQSAVDSYRSFLESVWSDEAMFMNYLEGVQFASACADLVASKKGLTNKSLSAILKRQAAVMTVRGAAREEYISDMGLSRF